MCDLIAVSILIVIFIAWFYTSPERKSILVILALIVAVIATVATVACSRVVISGGGGKQLIPCTPSGNDEMYNNAPQGFKMETLTRHIISCMLNSEFVEVRSGEYRGKILPWLYTTDMFFKKIMLDLDGYSEYYRIAFEYQGPQHFTDTQNNNLKFHYTINNDREKAKKCAENGVKLIIIPYTITRQDLPNYIRSRLYDAGVIARASPYMPANLPEVSVDIARVDKMVINRKNKTVFIPKAQ